MADLHMTLKSPLRNVATDMNFCGFLSAPKNVRHSMNWTNDSRRIYKKVILRNSDKQAIPKLENHPLTEKPVLILLTFKIIYLVRQL
jgi:hypothetical protein